MGLWTSAANVRFRDFPVGFIEIHQCPDGGFKIEDHLGGNRLEARTWKAAIAEANRIIAWRCHETLKMLGNPPCET